MATEEALLQHRQVDFLASEGDVAAAVAVEGSEVAVASDRVGLMRGMARTRLKALEEEVAEVLTGLVTVVMEVVDLAAVEEDVGGLTSRKMGKVVVMVVDLAAEEDVGGLTSQKMEMVEVDLAAGEDVVGLTSQVIRKKVEEEKAEEEVVEDLVEGQRMAG